MASGAEADLAPSVGRSERSLIQDRHRSDGALGHDDGARSLDRSPVPDKTNQSENDIRRRHYPQAVRNPC